MQKSLAKVIKIRTDRAALPITAYQDAIVNAVAENPCVLVAGDTGCGKSTQVRTPKPCFLLCILRAQSFCGDIPREIQERIKSFHRGNILFELNAAAAQRSSILQRVFFPVIISSGSIGCVFSCVVLLRYS